VIDIGLSIVQGSGIGPTLYIVMKNDLCTVSAVNDIFQYADDIDTEFQNVKAWAANNCLKLNLSKTKEIIFKLPRVQYFPMPPALDNIEQSDCCKLLGVIFSRTLKRTLISSLSYHSAHSICTYLNFCVTRFFLMFNYQLLLMLSLSHVFCMPSLHGEGFLSIELVNRINVL